MPTHLALLRGINVGGGGKVPMAELRVLLTGLGHSNVKTYVQTGNIIFTPSPGDAEKLAAELRDAIKASYGVQTSAVVLTKAELSKVISANPYPDEPIRNGCTGVFLLAEPQKEQYQRSRGCGGGSRERRQQRQRPRLSARRCMCTRLTRFGASELARTC
jgi:uncharacterized protein (DUF1697 family)